MKSVPASVTLVAAAILQAMASYQYTDDSITVSGQVFFPLLFALMAVYLAWRNKDVARFGVLHAVFALLGFAALIVTVVGRVAENAALYPSWKIYYGCLAVLVLELFFRILATPKKVRTEEADAPARPVRRRRRVAGQGPTHLVARPKDADQAPVPAGNRAEAGETAPARETAAPGSVPTETAAPERRG